MFFLCYICMYVWMDECSSWTPQQIPCLFAHTWCLKLTLFYILFKLMVQPFLASLTSKLAFNHHLLALNVLAIFSVLRV